MASYHPTPTHTHSPPRDSVTRPSQDLVKRGLWMVGQYLTPAPSHFVSRSAWRCRATMLSLKLPQLLQVHQIPRVRGSTPNSYSPRD